MIVFSKNGVCGHIFSTSIHFPESEITRDLFSTLVLSFIYNYKYIHTHILYHLNDYAINITRLSILRIILEQCRTVSVIRC